MEKIICHSCQKKLGKSTEELKKPLCFECFEKNSKEDATATLHFSCCRCGKTQNNLPLYKTGGENGGELCQSCFGKNPFDYEIKKGKRYEEHFTAEGIRLLRTIGPLSKEYYYDIEYDLIKSKKEKIEFENENEELSFLMELLDVALLGQDTNWAKEIYSKILVIQQKITVER